jgi:hypothetical protein
MFGLGCPLFAVLAIAILVAILIRLSRRKPAKDRLPEDDLDW